MSGKAEPYADHQWVSDEVKAGHHRHVIGGMWDELGALQLAFLKSRGLRPDHRLIDIGCGALRAGIKFVEYLNPSNYYGIDSNEALLDAGYQQELEPLGLSHKLPRSSLITGSDFDARSLGVKFDFAIAQSVFTHLPFNQIRACLEKTALTMRSGGEFYATFFLLPKGRSWAEPCPHTPGGVVTTGVADPYHYRPNDLAYACQPDVWDAVHIGEWNHPRAQQMMLFRRR